MANIQDLPDEILVKIFRNFTAIELNPVNLASRRFRDIGHSEQVWKWYCQRDFPVNEKYLWDDWTYRELYTKVLFKYSYIFGIWQRSMQHYGGLVFVQVEKEGIVGYSCLPPCDDSFKTDATIERYIRVLDTADYSPAALHRLRFFPLFIIKPTPGEHSLQTWYFLATTELTRGEGEIICDQLQLSNRPGLAAVTNDVSFKPLVDEDEILKSGNGFVINVNENEPFDNVSEHVPSDNYWYELEFGFRANHALVISMIYSGLSIDQQRRILYLSQHEESSHILHPLSIQRNIPAQLMQNFCVKPGLYNGTYSSHGWEIINVQYTDDGRMLEGIKVTGDPNVPAGEWTFRVDLTSRINLTNEDQLDVYAAPAPPMPNLQPFRIPNEFQYNNLPMEIPKVCHWRYLAQAHVAERNFTYPETIQAVFTGFEEDFFAILWLELNSVGFYCRANNIDDLI